MITLSFFKCYTFFFANVTPSIIFTLVRKNVQFLLQFTCMLWFSHKKYYDGIREPLRFDDRAIYLFILHKRDKLTGMRTKIWIWKVVMFQFIRNNRVWDFGIDDGKRFISFMRAGPFLELFVQTKLREAFNTLSKMAGFGRFWPVLDFFLECIVA